MKILSCIFLFLLFQTVKTEDLRKAYKTASQSEKEAGAFIDLAEHINKSALHQAYLGAAFALKAKFNGKKIQNLREAKSQIEAAVERKPKNIEIRMIRLSIQESLPAIAGYGKAIDEDTDFIVGNLKNEKKQALKEYIQGFIEHSKSFDAEEKSLLLQL